MSDDDLVGVAVNEDVCIGAGQCEMLEEEIFYVDEDTVIAGVIGTGVLPRDRAARVAETCPSAAISMVEIANGGGEEE
jgi:ferredoxin